MEYRVVGETVNGLNEAVFLSNDNAINWLYTVQQSLNDHGNQKTFVLYTDWEAGYNRNYTIVNTPFAVRYTERGFSSVTQSSFFTISITAVSFWRNTFDS